MGNHNGDITLHVFKISKKKVRKGLMSVISALDSDYEDYLEECVFYILKNNKTIEEQIEATLMGDFGVLVDENEKDGIFEAEISTFFLQHDGHCSGYEHKLTDIGNHILLSIAVGS